MADIVENPTYFIDTNGEEHQIFPMVINDIPVASRLFSKLNSDMYAGLNLPSPMYHDRGKLKGQLKIDKKTKEPILDYTAYNAMMQLVSMATHEEEQEFSSWVNMTNIIEILDLYRGISEVKKKIANQTLMETSTMLSQLSLRTQAKQESPLEDIQLDS